MYSYFYSDDICITGIEGPISGDRLIGLSKCLAEGAMMPELVL